MNNNDANTHLESLYIPNYGKYSWVGQDTSNDVAVHNVALLRDNGHNSLCCQQRK